MVSLFFVGQMAENSRGPSRVFAYAFLAFVLGRRILDLIPTHFSHSLFDLTWKDTRPQAELICTRHE